MRLKVVLVFLSLLMFSGFAKAQYFSTGEDPAHIKWRELRTTNFQIIFPEEYEDKAQEMANIFERVYEYGYHTLDHAPRKISVILHTHAVKSNGLVAWSPKRMELFPTPNQRIYAQDWIEQLAIHEFRHVVQMDKVQTEMPFILKAIFGEQAAAAVVGAYLPFWFLEGDAVTTETALSKVGRGRTSSFLMENKALAVEKGNFSFSKMTLGSYNEYIPNRYKFGYWFVGGVRAKYGDKTWSDVLTEIGNKPLSFSPLNRSLRKTTGKTKETLYQDIFDEYLQKWTNEIRSLDLTDHQTLSSDNKTYTNYKYVSELSDSSVIAYKTSRDDIGRFVLLENGKESVIYTPGTVATESFSVTDDYLIWAESRPDPRWTHADKYVIVIYNMKDKTKQVFQSENKLFSPSISPNKNSYVVVETDYINNYFISIYSLKDNDLIGKYSTDSNDFFLTPNWSEDGRTIFFIGLSDQGKYLGELELGSGTLTQLTAPVFYDIRNPEFSNGKLYYTSSKTGIDNIFSMDLESGEIKQKTSVAFGADYASVSDSKLFFSNYSSDGYSIAELPLSQTLDKSDSEIEPYEYELANKLAEQEKGIVNFSTVDSLKYQTKPYRKLAHAFNFHSWAPVYINVNDYEVKPGISFMSQNKLGTFNTNLGYEYNNTEEAGTYKAEIEYSGLYPIISTELGYTNRKISYFRINQYYNSSGNLVGTDTLINKLSSDEINIDVDVRVPLYFNSGKYNQVFQPEIKYSYLKIIADKNVGLDQSEGSLSYLLYRLYFINSIRRSELDIIPDWGQEIDIRYQHSIRKGWDIGVLKSIETNLFFPGLKSNHGIKIYNGYQEKETDNILTFGDVVSYPRGFNSFLNNEIYSFGVDYVMPLCYPDLNLGKLIYLKRLRASFFYDYAKLTTQIRNEDGSPKGLLKARLESFGTEIIGDGHILRFVAPVSMGIRAAYMPTFQDFSFELLFSIDFNSI